MAMTLNQSDLKDRLANLQDQRQAEYEALVRTDGAVAECQRWIAELRDRETDNEMQETIDLAALHREPAQGYSHAARTKLKPAGA